MRLETRTPTSSSGSSSRSASANVALWSRSSEEDRARVGLHAERGRESFSLLFRMLAGHDRFHMAQARRALDAVS